MLVIGNGSEHPKFTNISTRVFVASAEFNLSNVSAPDLVESFVMWFEANEHAAFAYDKQVRPS